MEGLISARVNPVSASSIQEKSVFLPKFSSRAKKIYFGCKIKMMKNPKSFTLVAASVQPQEASKPGSSNNKLPSKGNIQDPSESSRANENLPAGLNFLGVCFFLILLAYFGCKWFLTWINFIPTKKELQ